MKIVHHYAAVYETTLVENDSIVLAAPPVKVEIITGPGYTFRLSNDRAIIGIKGEVGEEVQIQGPPPIDFEEGKRYIVVSTRTFGDPSNAEEACRRDVDRITAIIGLLTSPTLFAVPIYIGWIGERGGMPLMTNVMFSKPERLSRRPLEKGIAVARSILSKDATMRDRFDLVARLYQRAVGLPPTEEAFLWAWMCLEVFPMQGTRSYRHIASYLSEVTGRDEAKLSQWLGIKRLHTLRSKLVHAGHLGLTPAELFANLTLVKGIVYTVMRGMCGLPYDGELERVCAPAA